MLFSSIGLQRLGGVIQVPQTTSLNSEAQDPAPANLQIQQDKSFEPAPNNIDLTKVQGIIDKYGRGKAPVKAEDFLKVSQDTGVPIDLMLAQAIKESNIGTAGRATKTLNIFNVGNTDGGDGKPARRDKYNEFQDDWLSGMYRYGNLIKKEYVKDPNNITAEELIQNDFIRPKGGRYATAPTYTQDISGLIKKIRKQLEN